MLDLQLCPRHPVPYLGGLSPLRERQLITDTARGVHAAKERAECERIQNTGLFGGGWMQPGRLLEAALESEI